MSDYLLDTNIVSKHMDGDQNVLYKLAQTSINGEKVFINGIVYYEIEKGLLALQLKSQNTKYNNLRMKFTNFLNDIPIIWLDSKDIFDEAASIYADLEKRAKLIPVTDILIAATAKIENLVIVTNDLDHFPRVSGIQTDYTW
jgi:predicted nucleic acid-binding protein